MMVTETEKRWAKEAAAKLVGRTITEVRYLTDVEKDNLDWHAGSLVMLLDDGNGVYASTDDEGNGPGALFTTFEDLQTIPVI